MVTPNNSRSPNQSHYSYDSSSVSSISSPQTQTAFVGGLMGASPRPRNSNYPNMSVTLGPSTTSFHTGFGSSANSPGAAGSESMATKTSSSSGTPTTASSQLSQANTSAQKRAYRQRRKDPSCDACRERKVKCDATEMTSCSECSSRNVKCQFTKETNRRMSSIKQVQDLEKQIISIKRENSHLRHLMSIREGQMDVDTEPLASTIPSLPEIGSHPRRRQRPPPPHDLSRARTNLRNYGRGLFKPPSLYRQVALPARSNTPRPELPPKHIADHLLHSYYTTIHVTIPILHWPTFEQEYEEVYRLGSLQVASQAWVAVLFAVFGVGLMFSTDPIVRRPQVGKGYIESAMMLVDTWTDDLPMDHARVAILISIFLAEMNLKSAAWTWLASAVRVSQDLGLHTDTGPWPTIEGEMRHRLWWGIYVWDRFISMELSRPLLIEDADCDVPLPAAVDDHYIRESGIMVPDLGQTPTNLLLPTIHVVRSITELKKTLKNLVIAPRTLATFDNHFQICLSAFPPPFQLASREALDPRALTPILALMNARLVLHRHNFSTSCPPDVRHAAIEACLRVAFDTVSILARIAPPHPANATVYRPVNSPPPVPSLGQVASTMMATHIWRCTLILLLTSQYDAALTCIRASTSIGNLREVNVACGRYLAFFATMLIDKRRAGNVGWLDNDEELMAYVSGDLQASTEHSWVWQGSETGLALKAILSPNSSANPIGPSNREAFAPGSEPRGSQLSDEERRDWGGWERVEYLVQLLMREGPGQPQLPPVEKRPLIPYSTGPTISRPSETPRYAPAMMPPLQERPTEEKQPSKRPSDRISIASII